MYSSRKKMLQGVSQIETITLIVVCILLYTQPSNLVYFSNTILGKLLLITSLVLATIHSTFAGFCIALLIVVFSYQTYEGLESGTIKESTDSVESSTKTDSSHEMTDGVDKTIHANVTDEKTGTHEVDSNKKTDVSVKGENTGVITNNKFKKLYCKDNKLRNKTGEVVEQKDISSVFKSIAFNKGECNPCEDSCSFTVSDTEERMHTEEKLRPADSNSIPIVK